jgi:ABC-type antimicrobial peptide transport system permease subunit
MMLNKDFIKLVLVGMVIGVPASWYFMSSWLGNFVYKINIGVLPFILAGVLAVVIAALTVGFHTYRAASVNPVNSLRTE